MLGKAMLTMKRSSEDKNTPVSTISAVTVGRDRPEPAWPQRQRCSQSVLS